MIHLHISVDSFSTQNGQRLVWLEKKFKVSKICQLNCYLIFFLTRRFGHYT